MMESSVLKKRVTVEDLIRFGECPIKEFTVHVMGLDFEPITSFVMVVDITRQNFRRKAIKETMKLLGDRKDYFLDVEGKYSTYRIHGERLSPHYRVV